jgi:di/tricarboxylate transporter
MVDNNNAVLLLVMLAVIAWWLIYRKPDKETAILIIAIFALFAVMVCQKGGIEMFDTHNPMTSWSLKQVGKVDAHQRQVRWAEPLER